MKTARSWSFAVFSARLTQAGISAWSHLSRHLAFRTKNSATACARLSFLVGSTLYTSPRYHIFKPGGSDGMLVRCFFQHSRKSRRTLEISRAVSSLHDLLWANFSNRGNCSSCPMSMGCRARFLHSGSCFSTSFFKPSLAPRKSSAKELKKVSRLLYSLLMVSSSLIPFTVAIQPCTSCTCRRNCSSSWSISCNRASASSAMRPGE